MVLKVAFLFFIYTLAQCSHLPDWCYDPPGDDCSWYKECLVRRFPCEANSDSYALSFGDAICNEFTSRQSDFSEKGKIWINTTRACLQKQLAPVLSRTLSCPEIQSFAFNTHSHCYSNPPSGSPSFCELPFSDWLRVTWIVKSSFVIETSKTFTQVLQILGKCI